jgi:tetratricopeptide (TPR) repeat protein
VGNQLSDVESYIEDRPDSALTVLESLQKSNLDTKELKARYSLLYAMALDKNYIDTTDVSIIEPAVRYYERHGSADEKMKAYYYQGIAYFNKEEYDNAIVSFSYAEEQIPDATDMRYVGLVYSRISDLYNRSRNTDDELKYVDLAADIFAKYGIGK